jgi:phosphate transport system substrate-binding protein
MKDRVFRFLGILLAGTLVLSACAGGAATSAASQPVSTTSQPLTGTLSISGAFALYPMMTVWADKFQKIHPDTQFDIQAGGSGKGMTDALAGAVDIGMVSRSIKPQEESRGAFWVSVAKDAVFPLISAKNPAAATIIARGINPGAFKKIFITGEFKTWGQVIGNPAVTDAIHVYTRSDSAGAADTWAQFCGGKVQGDILTGAIGVNGEPALVDTVAKDPLGIGYSNLNSVYDATSGSLVAGIIVAPIDVNANGIADPDEYYKTRSDAIKAISDGKYPSPPSRLENLVTKGKPSGLVQAFIAWILTDGQQYLDQAGYVPLTPAQQTQSLAKIK